MFLWLLTVCMLQCTVQASYEVVFEDAECFDINEKYVKECEINVDYDSEYGSKLDAYLEILGIPYDSIKLEVDTFTTQMGEYTLPMAIHLEGDLCKFAEEKNSMGYLFIKSVNIEICPPKPGIYKQERFVINNMDALPSSFPEGHYLLNSTLSSEDIVLFRINLYIRVY
ncbi:uncharacterized protein LOC122719529 [Apis laboriosa]|uniref:uncharacterized protein LOC122719529 n=1 Tax=Apis laboriosa TaxID=183418 RepID=UPI001CC7C347|nr:uncharacterized protein LOC122719529 [Apis laboriosa]